MIEQWKNFKPGVWCDEINVRDFIQSNYTLYLGDESFLAPPTEATTTLNQMVFELSKQEREAGGVLDADTSIISTLTSHKAGYLNKDLEKITAEMNLLGTRLNNPNFVNRAPAELVKKEQDRFAFLTQSKQTIEQKLSEL